MSPVADYLCTECSAITEEMTVGPLPKETDCRACGKRSERIITVSGTQGSNEAPDWMRGAADVAGDSESARIFKAEPNRTNYHKWMQSENVRPLEPGEKTVTRGGLSEADKQKMNKSALENLRRMRRIEI